MTVIHVREPRTGFPIPYRSWEGWRRGEPAEAEPWRPCGTCWGQRRIWVQLAEGLVPTTCQQCLGLGEIAPAPA